MQYKRADLSDKGLTVKIACNKKARQCLAFLLKLNSERYKLITTSHAHHKLKDIPE